MGVTTTIVLAFITGGGLSATITGIFMLIKERKHKDNGISNGIQLLLYDRIKMLAKKYITAGQIASEDLEDITRMWKCYHDELNGNGYLDRLMKAVNSLPVV